MQSNGAILLNCMHILNSPSKYLPRKKLFGVFNKISIVPFIICFLITFWIGNSYLKVFWEIEDVRVVRYKAFQPPDFSCPIQCEDNLSPEVNVYQNVSTKTEEGILILSANPSKLCTSSSGKKILQQLDAFRIMYKVISLKEPVINLNFGDIGLYSIILIEDFYEYLKSSSNLRGNINGYCKKYKVGMLFMVPNVDPGNTFLENNEFMLKNIQPRQYAGNFFINTTSAIPFITKKCLKLEIIQPSTNSWTFFNTSPYFSSILSVNSTDYLSVVIKDDGLYDDVEKVFFGGSIDYWVIQLLFHDTILYFEPRLKIKFSRERYLQIDVDDIFVGQQGTRIVAEDVDYLIKSQQILRKSISNFSYTLGFSGYFFRKGNILEKKGDEYLIEKKDNFLWFPHMWRHNHAQDHDEPYLKAVMTQNRLFAENFKLPLVKGYAVSPQHIGVYPILDYLYDAWKEIWDITITSTEEYPHFKPMGARRGFKYNNISILPRQTCGLYTHTLYYHAYPGGYQTFLDNIFGGNLFFSILLNPYNVFMTHQQNYAHDRLAEYTFRNIVNFFKCYTNINFKWVETDLLRNKYFETFPEEQKIIWTNPCDDTRHIKMLSPKHNCIDISLPNLLIIGPQKTGTTALASFLKLHPDVGANDILEDSFEEVQFFSSDYKYEKGIYWYSSFFRNARNQTKKIIFDKTANYFDHPTAPLTTSSLLGNPFVVIVLKDPVFRAYSWYQHMRFHDDPVANKYTFEEVMLSNNTDTVKLKSRCFTPGRYAYHLLKWLRYYPPSKIITIDADSLLGEPSKTLSLLVKRIGLPEFNFTSVIKYNDNKGFHCAVIEGHSRCLGRSKGRKYSQLSEETIKKIDELYKEENKILYNILHTNKFSIPVWLKKKLL
uniref:[heparan sulfate]-glucosamine N-sulfotransferase n=1 Tax=Strongyloides venezuelensis TaxID=75913 RepID=A0A0K0F9S9_STRVS